MRLSRRGLMRLGMAAMGGLAFGRGAKGSVDETLVARWRELEQRSGGRMGVALLDTGSGRMTGYRENERFAMCSTFKLLAAAAVLRRVDEKKERLERVIRFSKAEVVPGHSPVTRPRAGGPGMTLDELCDAAMTQSDNAAANLLVASLGGAAAVTGFARGLGDGVTRLDRVEPELNEARPGDPRDTTSPRAMAEDVRRLVTGEALSAGSKAKLSGWLVANTTGTALLRAGLPAAWRVGDKTGSGDQGTSNDVAVVWVPGRAPLVVACYLTQAGEDAEKRKAVIADVGRSVAEAVSR